MNAGATNTPHARVWDLPTRLFHWVLVALVVVLYASGKFDLIDMRWHVWAGCATLALLLFRLLWGFAGSQTSRFVEFVRGPGAVIAYLRSLFSGAAKSTVGHNPLGGWSVLALLLSLLLQTVSGLFASDEVEVDGPLVAHVSVRTAKWMTRLHHWNESVLLALIALHVVAVLLYLLLGRRNLVAPMIHGRDAHADPAALRFASGWRALALFAASAAAVTLLVWFSG
jgi:cytochrome b